MHSTYVIKKPRVTEKAMHATEHHRYAFDVDVRATKTDIKEAIEKLYKVRVEGVATQVRKGRRRRTKFGWLVEPKSKTALVKLHPDDMIDLI